MKKLCMNAVTVLAESDRNAVCIGYIWDFVHTSAAANLEMKLNKGSYANRIISGLANIYITG